MNRRKAYLDLLLSGYRIRKFWKWKDNIIIQTIIDKENDFFNSFFIINPDFKKESKLWLYEDYQFSGAGQKIYLTKEIEKQNDKNTMLIEVIICDIDF